MEVRRLIGAALGGLAAAAGVFYGLTNLGSMETEGWAGSEDHVLEQIRICLQHVHPALDTSRLR